MNDIADNIPQMVWKIASHNGLGKNIEMLYANKQWKEYTGGKGVFDRTLIHPSDYTEFTQAWQQAVDRFQVRCRLRDNGDDSYQWFLTRAVRSESGGNVWYGTCTNISDFMDMKRDKLQLIAERNDAERIRVILEQHAQELAQKAKEAEETRVSLSQYAKELATKALNTEETRLVVSQEADKLAATAQVAETIRMELKEHASLLANMASNAEKERVLLQEHAKDLATTAETKEETRLVVEKEADKLAETAQVAEETRKELMKHASLLANIASDAEKERVLLQEHAKDLATTAESKEETRLVVEKEADKLAETAQVAETTRKELVIHACLLANQASDAEKVRLRLLEHAKELAEKARNKEDIRMQVLKHAGELETTAQVAEETRITLSKNAMYLANLAETAEQVRLELEESAHILLDESIRKSIADQQLKIVLNSIPIFLWVVDTNGAITMSEGKALGDLGTTPGRLVGRNIYETYIESERHFIRKALQGENIQRNIIIRGKDYELYYTPLKFNDGIIGVIILGRDTTEQLKAEKDRRETMIRENIARTDAKMKSAFLANMSHEMRTPLYGIAANIEFLLEERLSEEQRRYAEAVSQSVTSLTSVVNAMLDISEISILNEVVLEPRMIMNEILSRFKEQVLKKGLTMNSTVDDRVPTFLLGDVERIQQIIVNVVNNAVKFTLHGNISIGTSYVNNDLLITVQDSGIGISSGDARSIFSLFSQIDSSTTRSYGGLGLGLYIANKMAKLMKGSISFTSTMDVGSTFVIRLNLLRGAPIIATTDKKKPLDGMTILVVEDNLVNQKIVNKVLSSAGAKVLVADNGSIALDIWRKGRKEIDLIFMDCHMPVMDGYECTRTLRKEGCTEIIIALTANALLDNVQRCLDVGMNDYLSKPVKPRTLIEKSFASRQGTRTGD
jgi:signal transduction histidine kinase